MMAPLDRDFTVAGCGPADRRRDRDVRKSP
jgi:hypothetical protein